MKIFFFSQEYHGTNHKIVSVLSQAGHVLFANSKQGSHIPGLISIEDLQDEKDGFIRKIDAVVINSQNDRSAIGFVTALALSYHRPVLILVSRGRVLPADLDLLCQDTRASSWVSLEYYDSNRIPDILNRFTKKIQRGNMFSEKPTVKFTLRLTPSLYQQLCKRSKLSRSSKSVFVRNLILQDLFQ